MSAGYFLSKRRFGYLFSLRYAREDLAQREGEDAETSASYLTLKILLDNKADDTKKDDFR